MHTAPQNRSPPVETRDPVLRLPVTVNFACGASFAARQQHKSIEAGGSVRFEYVPWTKGGPTPHHMAFVEREGHGIGNPQWGPSMDRALAGIGFARAHDKEGAYVDAAFAAQRSGADLHDADTLTGIASSVGLDEARFMAYVDAEGAAWVRQAEANARTAGAKQTVEYLMPDGAWLGLVDRTELAARFAGAS